MNWYRWTWYHLMLAGAAWMLWRNGHAGIAIILVFADAIATSLTLDAKASALRIEKEKGR